MPYELPFIAVTEKAFTHLVNEQYAVLRRALSAHERLERIVLSERGLDGVAAALSTLIGGPALIFDARGEVLRGAPGAATRTSAPSAPELRERARAGARRGYVPGGALAGRALALPVSAPGRGDAAAPGVAVAAKDAGPLTELDRLTLHQAVTIVALELLRRRVADDTERRLAGDVLSALVSGRPRGRGARPPAGAVRAARTGGRARARPAARRAAAAEEALARAVREEAGGGLVAGAARFRARCCPRASATTSCSRWPSACAPRGARGGDRLPPAPAGASRRASCGAAFHEARCALEARALAATGAAARPAWRPTATSAPSSCCSRCRTTTRCGCSATRSWRRSRTPRAPTGAS